MQEDSPCLTWLHLSGDVILPVVESIRNILLKNLYFWLSWKSLKECVVSKRIYNGKEAWSSKILSSPFHSLLLLFPLLRLLFHHQWQFQPVWVAIYCSLLRKVEKDWEMSIAFRKLFHYLPSAVNSFVASLFSQLVHLLNSCIFQFQIFYFWNLNLWTHLFHLWCFQKYLFFIYRGLCLRGLRMWQTLFFRFKILRFLQFMNKPTEKTCKYTNI